MPACASRHGHDAGGLHSRSSREYICRTSSGGCGGLSGGDGNHGGHGRRTGIVFSAGRISARSRTGNYYSGCVYQQEKVVI